ncbi:MAG: hypothetical protein ACTS77_01975 [Arsenophonus sp. NC-TX2-MAG3]
MSMRSAADNEQQAKTNTLSDRTICTFQYRNKRISQYRLNHANENAYSLKAIAASVC